MARKIIRAGNSAAVTIPSDIMDRLGLEIGSDVQIEWDAEHSGALIIPARSRTAINPEFAELVEGFIDRYQEALEELAKR